MYELVCFVNDDVVSRVVLCNLFDDCVDFKWSDCAVEPVADNVGVSEDVHVGFRRRLYRLRRW